MNDFNVIKRKKNFYNQTHGINKLHVHFNVHAWTNEN